MAGRPLRRMRMNPSAFWTRNIGYAVEDNRLSRDRLFNYRQAPPKDRDLSGLNMRKYDMAMAYLAGADLRKSDLSEANLTSSGLYGADLREANLFKAVLVDADIARADLRGADLRGANLRGAKLQGSKLKGALLQGADLRATDLRHTKFSTAVYDDKTRWPEGFNPANEGAVPAEKAGRPFPRGGGQGTHVDSTMESDFNSVGRGSMKIEVRFLISPHYETGTGIMSYVLGAQYRGQPRLEALKVFNEVADSHRVGRNTYPSKAEATRAVIRILRDANAALNASQ